MAIMILDCIGSGNGLKPDGTKPLPEPMLTLHLGGQFHSSTDTTATSHQN